MIRIARPLYADEDLGLELDNTVYALVHHRPVLVSLSMGVVPLHQVRRQAAQLDLRGNNRRSFTSPTGRCTTRPRHPDPRARRVLHHGPRLGLRAPVPPAHRRSVLHHPRQSNTGYARRYSHPADKTTGVRCDQTVVLTGAKGRKHYPQPLVSNISGTDKTFNFLTKLRRLGADGRRTYRSGGRWSCSSSGSSNICASSRSSDVGERGQDHGLR